MMTVLRRLLLALFVLGAVGLGLPALVRADGPSPSDPVLTLEPLDALRVGQTDTASVTAHFRTVEGKPIDGASLVLSVDGTSGAKAVTDASGTAFLHLPGDLAAGTHQLVVSFLGSRGSLSWVKPISASESLEILPATDTRLVVEPIDAVAADDRRVILVVAHLTTSDGRPLAAEDLVLVVDDSIERSASTDATGTAYLGFHRQLVPGEHRVEVRFAGGHGLQPNQATQQFSVISATATQIEVNAPSPLVAGKSGKQTLVARLTTDDQRPVPEATLTLTIDGTFESTGSTDQSGTASLRVRRQLEPGEHQVSVSFEGTTQLAPTNVSQKFVVAAESPTVLTVEPIGDLRVTSSKAAIIRAHLQSANGTPISGEPLQFEIDSSLTRNVTTDAAGVAEFKPSRDLDPGTHSLKVTFAGGDGLQSSGTTLEFRVLPVGTSALKIDPLDPITVGDTKNATVVGHLYDSAGAPVSGARVAFYVDDTLIRSESTDESGTVVLSFRPDLVAGPHRLKAVFDGTSDLRASSDTREFTVSPAVITVQIVPPLAGVRVSFDGNTFVTDNNGIAKVRANRSGVYRMEILPWTPPSPGVRAKFVRWLDDVFVPYRDVAVPSTSQLQAGFATEYRVGLRFVDLDDQPVPVQRISSAVLIGSNGARFVFKGTEPQWLPGGRIIKTSDGLQESAFFYSVESVYVETVNVVNSKQQKFAPTGDTMFPVRLLLYSARIRAVDAFFGFPVGSGIDLEFPDGHVERHPFTAKGDITLHNLIRGQYRVSVIAPGPAISRPIALTRNVDEHIPVLTYYDIGAVVLIGLLFVLGLPLIGHPNIIPRVFDVARNHQSLRQPLRQLAFASLDRIRTLANLGTFVPLALASVRARVRSDGEVPPRLPVAIPERVAQYCSRWLNRGDGLRFGQIRPGTDRPSPMTQHSGLVMPRGRPLPGAASTALATRADAAVALTIEQSWTCQSCQATNTIGSPCCSRCGCIAAEIQSHPFVQANPIVLTGIPALEEDDQEAAYRPFAQATESQPQSELAWTWRRRAAPSLEDAIHSVKQLFRLDPGNVPTRQDLALAWRRYGRASGALVALPEWRGLAMLARGASVITQVMTTLRFVNLDVVSIPSFVLGLLFVEPLRSAVETLHLPGAAAWLPDFTFPDLVVALPWYLTLPPPFASTFHVADLVQWSLSLSYLALAFILTGESEYTRRIAIIGGIFAVVLTVLPFVVVAHALVYTVVAALLLVLALFSRDKQPSNEPVNHR